jgi:ParB family chromosome partitioning protein
MTSQNLIYVRALDCVKSARNVRTQSDAAADAELAANIGETGLLLQNLIGVPVPRKKGQFEIFGGGRRLDGVHNNISSGKLAADFMVPILIVKNAKDAIEMSLAENYYNLRMNPADECRAFLAIIEQENKTPADLAKRLGVTERFVLGRIRLAGLAAPIFEALRTSAITLDVAKAYASTADTDRQAKVFDQLATVYHRHNVGEIRRMLAIGSYTGSDTKALFVGRAAYDAAGGRVDGDLFSNEETEIWTDGDILDRLADDKLAEAAAALRDREGYAEVRTVAATTVPFHETYQLSRLIGEPQPLAPDAAARKNEIEAEIAAIEEAAEQAEAYTEEQEARLELLEEELGAVAEPTAIITDEQRTSAIAYVVIGQDGRPELHEQLYIDASRAPIEIVDPDDEGGDEEDQADTDAERESGADETPAATIQLSQRLIEELAMQRTELIALHVARDPAFALDLGTFIMVDEAHTLSWNGMPSELRARAPSPRVDFKSDAPAAEAWVELEEALDRSWLDHKELYERYDAFCALDEQTRRAWLGFAVARTLQAVPYGASGSGFLTHLGRKLAIDVAAWWRPTARSFFDRMTKPAIITLLGVIGGQALQSRYAAARKFDLSLSAEKVFAGETITEVDVKDRALRWLPAPMQFGVEPTPDQPTDGGDAAAVIEAPLAATDAANEENELSEAA